MSLTAFLIRLALVLVLIIVIDLYAYQGIKAATAGLSPRWRDGLRITYWVFTAAFCVAIIVGLALGVVFRGSGNHYFFFLMGLFVMVYVPKLLFMSFLLLEDGYRLSRALFAWIADFALGPKAQETDPQFMVSRSEFLSRAALAVAAVPFGAIAYGLWRGGYNYKVHEHTLYFRDLPAGFDGYRIVQLSDIHSGSFTNRSAVERGVALANAQNPDLILFTGDIVNNVTRELEPWAEVFAKLSSPGGIYSILGNHDYGDYVSWPSTEAKAQNLQRLKALHAQMGFKLLLNQHTVLRRGDDQLALVGVENWGLPPFPQYGNLNQALAGSEQVPFKILMSHDPSHWDAEVLHHPTPIQLTLSGHTHGMQFGVEIPGFRWSPVQYRYPRWAGLYEEADKLLYVNRGFGFIGFPGRVGIWPEVTVLTLKRA